MKKIRKTLAGIIALSMFASNAVYISAAEEVKNDAGSQTVSEDAAGSSAEVKYTKELAEVMAKADNSEKIPVYISLADIDPSVLDAKIREKFNGKYGTLDEYYNYEEVILPRIIEEAEKEFGEALAHARVFKDEETGEIIARGFDTYVKDGSELLKLMNSMSYEERNAYIHSGFSEEDLKKAYESSEKGYSIVTARMSHDIDDYRMVVVNSKIELQHKNVSDCLTKYISEDEILSNAVNNCMAMLTKDQIEEISRDSQVTSIMYAPPVPADSSGALIVEEDEIKPGDIYSDGRIDLSDLTILSLFLIGDTDLEDSQKKAADVDGDGEITLADLAMLRQYLSKKIDSLGNTQNTQVAPVKSDETDITDSCETFNVGVDVEKWGSGVKSIIISSMDDYDKYIGIDSEENKKLAKKGIEINEEFFKTNRLAVMVDNSEGCNGVKYTLTGVKLDKDGNVHLYYDKEIPEFMTALASVFHYITVVPASENSESETIVHFNEIRERTYITDKCTIVNSTNVGFKGGSYPVVSGMVTSMEQFEEEMSKNGIEPAGVIERLDISKEFFDDNFLVYQTLYSGNTNPKSWITRLSIDKDNNLTMDYITYTTVHYYEDGTKVSVGGEQMVYRMLAAAVPKSVIDPSDVASFVSNGHSQEGEDGYRIINQINEKSVKSASKTEVESKGNTVNISLIDSMEGFERINDLYDGKYTHIKDELLTDNFFKDNVLYIADQPSVKKNIEYKIEDLMVKSNGVLEVTVGTSINNDEPDEDDNTEWHLAAAIPRSELVFDNINADTKIQ